MPQPEIQVLNKGFVRLIDHMGSDLSVVNAARVSFGKVKESFDEGDAKLVDYLAAHEHTSPFRHTALTLHVKAPIFVFRQWMKHRIGSEFNEISGRYVEFPEDEFFVPEVFRRQAKVNKQGSEGAIDEKDRARAMEAFLESCRGAVAHFIRLRADAHAQWEIQQYAAAVRELVEPLYPVGLKALLAAGRG